MSRDKRGIDIKLIDGLQTNLREERKKEYFQ